MGYESHDAELADQTTTSIDDHEKEEFSASAHEKEKLAGLGEMFPISPPFYYRERQNGGSDPKKKSLLPRAIFY